MSIDTSNISLPKECIDMIEELFAKCTAEAPNYDVSIDSFRQSLEKTIDKFLLTSSTEPVSNAEIIELLQQIQANDLFLSIACANGNERAWWEFDHQHRTYLERVARHLAKTDIDAQEVVDTVYIDLYGQKIVEGERVAKFATYSGRGSLRGWLRTVIWHSLVDMHRASHDEISLDEMTENVGEGVVQSNFADLAPDGEEEMITRLARERYRQTTVLSLDAAFQKLEDHEKLLLLYYHVESLKLREIARLVENEDSVLRGWFQRKASPKEEGGSGRIHESTIMRWLEKCYARIFIHFQSELTHTHSLQNEEIEICLDLATQDIASNSLFRHLSSSSPAL